MTVDYYLLDPTGNITALVSTPVPPDGRAAAARCIMESESTVEQVGFLLPGGEGFDIGMRMAGGEFCGNATMSAAVVYCSQNGLNDANVTVRVSGSEKPVAVGVSLNRDGSYRGCVEMPGAVAVAEKKLELDGKTVVIPVVSFPGISHIITETAFEREYAERGVRKWCRDLGCDALGIMQVDRNSCALVPLVYVRKGETLFWENSCASGTTAAAIWFAEECGHEVSFRFSEPGGVLHVTCGGNRQPILEGRVRITAVKTLEM